MSYWDFARSPVSVRLLLDFAQARGIATSALLRGTRLTPALLADPDFAVSARQELQVARALLARLGAPGLGLQLGLNYQLSAYGMLGYGMMSSATGGAALALARRFLPLTYAFVQIGQRSDGAYTTLVFEPPPDLEPDLQRFVVERALGACARLLRDVLGAGVQLADCTLRYGAPAAGPARVLGVAVRYQAAENTLRLAHAQLLAPLVQANAVTAAMCERLCEQLLARRRTRIDTTALVREHLAALPAGQAPDLPALAQLLGVSARTVKRRLQQEGSSFRALAQAARYERAQALLAAGGLSLGEVAAELGFADGAAFSQAYKRWSGAAPSSALRPALTPALSQREREREREQQRQSASAQKSKV